MTLNKIAAVLDGTRRTALRMISKLREQGFLTYEVRRAEPIVINLTEKGRGVRFSESRIRKGRNQRDEMFLLQCLQNELR